MQCLYSSWGDQLDRINPRIDIAMKGNVRNALSLRSLAGICEIFGRVPAAFALQTPSWNKNISESGELPVQPFVE